MAWWDNPCTQFVTFNTSAPGREHDHGRMTGKPALPYIGKQVIAVAVGHLYIADDQVGQIHFQLFHCFLHIVDVGNIIILRQEIFEEQANVQFVVYN